MVPKIGQSGAEPAESRHGLAPAPAEGPALWKWPVQTGRVALRLF